MTPAKSTISVSDVRGASRLAIAGVTGVVDLVEAMHRNIARVPGLRYASEGARTTGVTRLVYRGIHGVVGAVGSSLDAILAGLAPVLGDRVAWRGREPLLAALNGVLGDYLAATNNPLAIPLALRRDGATLPDDAAGMAAMLPEASGKIVVLIHGLCMTDLQAHGRGRDHGTRLTQDLGHTSVYARYNSGRHISVNGRELANALEQMVSSWPVRVTELVLIGHSMGGLVARSACHYGDIAGHAWRRRLTRLVFLGTPHHGAPLERGGNWVDVVLGLSRYSAPLARLGQIRSAGITDLRFGNLVDEDWSTRDRFALSGDRRVILPLPADIACYTIAATAGAAPRDARHVLGDGIVPLSSALGRHTDPRRTLAFTASRQYVARATHHLELLQRPDVYAQIRNWLAEPQRVRRAPRKRGVGTR